MSYPTDPCHNGALEMADIAVIIPCFNLGAYVEEAIESALRQTLPPSDIVVVDDGSTDHQTREVLAGIAASRVRVVRTSNQGVSAARNRGIRITTAPYLVTLDADDRLAPTYLERTTSVLDEKPAVAFVSTALRAFGDAAYMWTPPKPSVRTALIRGGPHPATIFRREVWDAVGGFNEGAEVQGCEDLDFWLGALQKGFEGVVLPEPLLDYRVRSNSVHQRLVAESRQSQVMSAVLRRHGDVILAQGPDLMADKELFLEELRSHHEALDDSRRRLQAELSQVEGALDAARAALEERGSWADVDGVSLFKRESPPLTSDSIPQHYIRSFVTGLPREVDWVVIGDTELAHWAAGVMREAADGSGRVRVVGRSVAAGYPPASMRGVVAIDVLQCAPSPHRHLGELIDLVEPGGLLACVLPAIPAPGAGGPTSDLRGFTEAGARHLFAEFLPLAAFSVVGYGNVLAGAAALAGRSAACLAHTQLDHVDPMFPVLYGVRAVRPIERADA